MQLQPGVARLEVWPARDQPAHQQGRLAGQHPALLLARAGAQIGNALAHQIQPLANGLGQCAALGSQKDAPAAPLEQRQAQVVFQQPHGAADGAMGQVQLVCSAAEVFQPGCSLKAAQRQQGGQAAVGEW